MKINKYYQAHPPTQEQVKKVQETQMREAAKAYEKYFLDEMVKAMRSTVPEGEGLIKPNFAEKLYRENLDQEYVKNWAESGGVGLSDLIYEQLKAQIEGVSAPSQVNKAKGLAAYENPKPQMKPLDD